MNFVYLRYLPMVPTNLWYYGTKPMVPVPTVNYGTVGVNFVFRTLSITQNGKLCLPNGLFRKGWYKSLSPSLKISVEVTNLSF